MTPEFTPFPKMARLLRDCTITEKIDGTNAAVGVTDEGEVYAQSRSRIITPGKSTDNFGFAGWVEENKHHLIHLGPGVHFGEWWGQGIQRRYGLEEKRFSLFNTARWADGGTSARPGCCHVVPVLYEGAFALQQVHRALEVLQHGGSWAAPHFSNPEGIVLFHHAANACFKVTLDKNDGHKGAE